MKIKLAKAERNTSRQFNHAAKPTFDAANLPLRAAASWCKRMAENPTSTGQPAWQICPASCVSAQRLPLWHQDTITGSPPQAVKHSRMPVPPSLPQAWYKLPRCTGAWLESGGINKDLITTFRCKSLRARQRCCSCQSCLWRCGH